MHGIFQLHDLFSEILHHGLEAEAYAEKGMRPMKAINSLHVIACFFGSAWAGSQENHVRFFSGNCIQITGAFVHIHIRSCHPKIGRYGVRKRVEMVYVDDVFHCSTFMAFSDFNWISCASFSGTECATMPAPARIKDIPSFTKTERMVMPVLAFPLKERDPIAPP